MASQAYNVPVILPDLRKEESYLQIVDALEYLDAVANDVFNRITFRYSAASQLAVWGMITSFLPCRVGENRDQLTQINNRILTTQAKISKLRSASTKAARVFSSPKYPAPESVTDYRTIYEDINPMLHKVRQPMLGGRIGVILNAGISSRRLGLAFLCCLTVQYCIVSSGAQE